LNIRIEDASNFNTASLTVQSSRDRQRFLVEERELHSITGSLGLAENSDHGTVFPSAYGAVVIV
jgi:hypothetical protein